MKLLLYILFTIFSVSLFSQVKVGPDGDIEATGNYPVVKNSALRGNIRRVRDTTARNAIALNFRDTGMIVFTVVDSTYYSLIGGISNSNWVRLFKGAGTQNITDSSDNNATTAWVQQWVYANYGKFQEKTIGVLPGSTGDTLTSPELINQAVTELTRSGIGWEVIGSGVPDSFQVRVNRLTGGLKFGMDIQPGEKIMLRYQPPSAFATWPGGSMPITVASYTEMIPQLTGDQYKVFYVKSDEVNPDESGNYGRPAIYFYYNGFIYKNMARRDIQ